MKYNLMKYSYALDEEELIKKLPSKFRQNTRRSYRKELTSKISKEVDLDNFYKL